MKKNVSQEWPQWRGPQRNGHAAGARLPQTWPNQLPKPKWRTPVGIGYSSPVIADGQVFIQGRDTKGNELCFGIDDASGKVQWKYAYPSSFAPPDPSAGKGPNSTPTVDRGQVTMLGLGGMLHHFEAKTGKLLWKHDLAKEFWGVAKGAAGDDWFPVCGASASALSLSEEIILPVGGKKAGCITAFDRKSGAIRWKALDDRSSYASPVLAEVAGVRQLVAFTGKRMVGLDAISHTLLWEYPFTAGFEQTIIMPTLWKNRVIIAGEAKPIVALELSSEGGKLTQKVAWQNAELAAYLATPLLLKDHLIGFDHRSRRLVCLDCATGKSTWTSPQRMGKMFVTLTGAGESVLVLSDTGELHIIAADPSAFRLTKTYKVGEPGTLWSQVAVVENRLYIRDQENLSCYVV